LKTSCIQPTATQNDADGHETESSVTVRAFATVGLPITVQAVPSKCSISPAAEPWLPTATQSVLAVQLTALNEAAPGPGVGGAVVVQMGAAADAAGAPTPTAAAAATAANTPRIPPT
jgi:hypothetical protein